MTQTHTIVQSRDGYIALVSAIVVSVLLLSFTLTLSLTGFFARYNVGESEYKARSVALAEACIETTLSKLAQDVSYNPVNLIVTVGSSTCTIVSVARNLPVSGKLTLKAKGVFRDAVTNLQVVTQTSTLSVVSWEEVPVFL